MTEILATDGTPLCLNCLRLGLLSCSRCRTRRVTPPAKPDPEAI